MGRNLRAILLHAGFTVSLIAQPLLSGQRQPLPPRASDQFAVAELRALKRVEREDFATSLKSSPARASLDAADLQAVSIDEKSISARMKWLYAQKWENYRKFYFSEQLSKDFPTTLKYLDALSTRIDACVEAEKQALEQRYPGLPSSCEHDVIWTTETDDELASTRKESSAQKRKAPIVFDVSSTVPLQGYEVDGYGETRKIQTDQNPRKLPSGKRDIPTIARDAQGAIVSVVMSDKHGQAIAQGSGFVVSKDGLILTNYHVISEGSSAVVKLPDGAFYSVDGLIAGDKKRDIAVIKAHGQNFRTVVLGNSDQVQVGQDVVAIGNPLSLESTVSNGIISGRRAIQEAGGDFLQITAPISPGSSGGPLFNMAGEVIGITTMYLRDGENLNFAIPVNDAKPLIAFDSVKLHDFPDESDSIRGQRQKRSEDSPAPKPVQVAETPVTARDFYHQLVAAGGFSGDLPGYACFSDDSHSTTFFTFTAYGFDSDYYYAQAKLPTFQQKMASGSDIVTPEEQKQFDIMEARQRTAPYLTLLMKGWLESLPPKAQQFFRNGGRILEEATYDKGVKSNTLEYQWNGTSWSLSIPPADPKAYSRTSRILGLSIEPSTMRYSDSVSETITVGWGGTAATGTNRYGPWSGACERVQNPK
jgi:S1-C subfamily serine protease